MSDTQPIPVSILTGFLGAGKTTLLNKLLKDPGLANAAVVINEFGDVGIDHLLVETADELLFEMASGCLCCSIRGDLIDTLARLIEKRDAGQIKPFDRVVIETTGLADPGPVLHTVMADPALISRYRLEGVVTLVDAVNGSATLDAHEEAVKQVAVADRIVLTKADLLSGRAGEDALAAIIARVRKLAPSARLLTTHNDEARAATLFNTGLYDAGTRSADVRRWLAAEAFETPGRARRAGRGGHHAHSHDHDHGHDVNRHDDRIRSFCLTSERAIDAYAFGLFLQLVQSQHGPNLLRMKGIVRLADDENRPVVIHAVQHVLHPPHRLEAWPDDDHRTRIVFITRDIHREELDKLLTAFTDPLGGGAEAFSDDTLSLRRGQH